MRHGASIFESSPWAPRMLSVFRIVAALVFMSFGSTKVFGFPPPPMPVPPLPLPSQLGIGDMLEIVAARLLHPPGVPAVLYCFFYLYLMLAGAGPWSLDAEIARARRHVDPAASRSTS